MIAVLDTSVILASLNKRDAAHLSVVSWLEADRPILRTTPLVLAEADHLLGAWVGVRGQELLWRNIEAGSYGETWWTAAGTAAAALARRHAELGLGLTDASLIALAEHLETTDLATLDHRHFRAVRPSTGGFFTLFPEDRS